MKLPPSLADDWASRGYYGTLSHNAKAVYQFYLGWYDANPADLNPLPRAEMAKKQLDYMGGAEAVLKRAREDFAAGQYRWVASVMSQLVFADPANKEARELGADALEQLGYQSEAATWRNAYLLGALELRSGVPAQRGDGANAELLKGVSIDLAFDFLGVRLNAAKAEGKHIVVNWTFTDLNQTYAMNLENSALTHTSGKLADNADVSVTLTRAALDAISLKQRTFARQRRHRRRVDLGQSAETRRTVRPARRVRAGVRGGRAEEGGGAVRRARWRSPSEQAASRVRHCRCLTPGNPSRLRKTLRRIRWMLRSSRARTLHQRPRRRAPYGAMSMCPLASLAARRRCSSAASVGPIGAPSNTWA